MKLILFIISLMSLPFLFQNCADKNLESEVNTDPRYKTGFDAKSTFIRNLMPEYNEKLLFNLGLSNSINASKIKTSKINLLQLTINQNEALQIKYGHSSHVMYEIEDFILEDTINKQKSNAILSQLKNIDLCRINFYEDLMCTMEYTPPDLYVQNSSGLVDAVVQNNETCTNHVRVCDASIKTYESLMDDLRSLISNSDL